MLKIKFILVLIISLQLSKAAFANPCQNSINPPKDLNTKISELMHAVEYMRGETLKTDYGVDMLLANQYLEALAEIYPNVMQLEIIDYVEDIPVYGVKMVLNPTQNPSKVFISSGVHGNESLSSIVALELMEDLLSGKHSAVKADEYYIIPFANPSGLKRAHRRMEDDLDLNRQFHDEPTHKLAKNLTRYITKNGPYKVALDLHGAIDNSFFIISTKEDDAHAKDIVANLIANGFDQKNFRPSTSGEYPGHAGTPTDPKRYMMYAPGVSTSSNHGTLKQFLLDHVTEKSYTLEYPRQRDREPAAKLYLELVEAFLYAIEE